MFRWAAATGAVLLLFVTSAALPVQAVVTQDSPNDIIVLMNFNWEEILTCKPNCIWLRTILALLLANWLGWVGGLSGSGGGGGVFLAGSMASLWKYLKGLPRGAKREKTRAQLAVGSVEKNKARGRGSGREDANVRIPHRTPAVWKKAPRGLKRERYGCTNVTWRFPPSALKDSKLALHNDRALNAEHLRAFWKFFMLVGSLAA